MRSLPSFVVLSLGFLAAAAPLLSPYTLHEKRTHVPAGWTSKRRHDPSIDDVPAHIALHLDFVTPVGEQPVDPTLLTFPYLTTFTTFPFSDIRGVVTRTAHLFAFPPVEVSHSHTPYIYFTDIGLDLLLLDSCKTIL